jgi:rare lipoprotein A
MMADSKINGRRAQFAFTLLAGASLAACATVEPRYASHSGGRGKAPPVVQGGERKVGKPYQVGGVWYVPREQPGYDARGIASWYGDAFHLKATANGETFDMNAVSAAHTTLPIPSMVEVTNLDNGRKLVVRVNDRGPFVDNRIIDLSREAARQLGYDRAGLANVRVRYLGPAPLTGPAAGVRYASAAPLPTRLPPPALAPLTAAAAPAPAPTMEPAAGIPAPAAGAISSQALPPITGGEISSAPLGGPPPAATPASALRVQAGAFSSEINAQRAVAQLSPAGRASIEPLQRADGLTLYRVVIPAPADEAGAYALRDRVAEIGFAEARVVRTF